MATVSRWSNNLLFVSYGYIYLRFLSVTLNFILGLKPADSGTALVRLAAARTCPIVFFWFYYGSLQFLNSHMVCGNFLVKPTKDFQKPTSVSLSSDLPATVRKRNPSRSFTYTVKPGALCFTCGFQCSAFERWQLTGRKWEVRVEGQTKQSKASFSLRAEGKHSQGKGVGGWNTVHIARMGSGYL